MLLGQAEPYLIKLKELLLLLEHRGTEFGLDALVKVVVAKGVRPLQDPPTVDDLSEHAGSSHFCSPQSLSRVVFHTCATSVSDKKSQAS